MNAGIRFLSWPAAAAWLCLAALSACGGGGGGGTSDTPSLRGNYFPLAVGDRWVYGTGAGGTDPVTLRATGTRRVDGQDGIVVAVEDALNGDGESVYVVSAAAVRQVPASGGDPLARAIGPLDVMRFPLHVGDSFVQIDKTIDTGMDLDGDGRPERAAVNSTVRVVGVESVTTPLASFADSLHLRTSLTAAVHLTSNGQTVSVASTVDDWYAPDVGSVRSVMTTSSQGRTETQTMVIVAYKVGARRSETVAPVARSLAPAAGGLIGPSGRIGVGFSESMDTRSLASAFTLTDPAGHRVQASVQASGSSATLVPASPLGSGRHVAQVSTAAVDLAANPMASALSWYFDVDATAPYLAEATPPDGGTDVPLDSSIVLRFSEAIDPASLHPGNVAMSAVGVGTVASDVPITVSLNGNALTITPKTALVRAQLYEVHVYSGLLDTVGNRMVDDVLLQFRADTGRFGVPVALAAVGLVDAVAVGDVNGDGRGDVVFSTGYTFNPARDFKLMIRLQRANGSLAPALVLDTRAEYVCRAASIAIGDLDGDGRNDLVLGAAGCGIQVFHQGSDGVLRATSFIDSSYSGKLRLVDLNGDGRLDMVGIGAYGMQFAVWLQAADGSMVLHASPAFEYYFPDLDVGDLNGDGRPDIVVTSNSGNPEQSIGIALQSSDGSFGPVTTRTALPSQGVSAVAVGDVNGDGRADVAVTYGGNGGRLGVMLQRANGSLAPMTALLSYDSPNQVEIADVNGDGRRDVVVGHSGWYAIGVYLQQADGKLSAEARYPANYGNSNPASMAVGDVSGDGRPDVLVAEALLRQRIVDVNASAPLRPRPGLARVLERVIGAPVQR